MRKTSFIVSLSLAFALGMQAQTKDGGISEQMLSDIRKAQPVGVADKAIFNAIASNAIDDLAKNFAAQGPVDNHFSVETPQQNIHNQKSSGRCWMFSGLNVLRANFAKRHADSLCVEFSHDYLFFYDQLEKANLMLQGVIDCAKKPIDDQRVQFFFRSPIGDGGTFCGVADLAGKYGLVPMGVMPETYSAENTGRMAKIVSSKLREFGLELRAMVANGKSSKAVQARKVEMLSTVYRILSLTLGEPVQEFTYAFTDKKGVAKTPARKYTPREFYEATVGGQLNGTFIMVMNDPRRPYHTLPMEEIASLAITSLKAGTKLYSSYDVGKQFDRKRGYLDTENYDYGSLFGTTFGMDKAQRIETFDSGSTHAMTLTAVDLDADGKPVKWKVENSWGATNGVNGCLIMTNRWFNDYMFRLVVDKAYVPADVQQLYDQKPTMVMPEDPLFGVDE